MSHIACLSNSRTELKPKLKMFTLITLNRSYIQTMKKMHVYIKKKNVKKYLFTFETYYYDVLGRCMDLIYFHHQCNLYEFIQRLIFYFARNVLVNTYTFNSHWNRLFLVLIFYQLSRAISALSSTPNIECDASFIILFYTRKPFYSTISV